MAELASAVSTLLGVISNEAQRLGRVRRDVQFIKEEIESMSSFLEDLSEASCEHNKQVQTWMKQVRILADDCKSRIDLYLYRGDPRFHLPRGGPRRYLLWAPWQLRKLVAQHRAADQLSELRDRAHDIGNRRLRYGVKIKMPESSSSSRAGLTESLLLLAEEEHGDDQHWDGSLEVAVPMTSMKMDKEDYFRRRLDHWIGKLVQAAEKLAEARLKSLPPSIAFVVTEMQEADALVSEALDVAKAHFKRAEDAQNKGVPPETSVVPHEDKALPQEIELTGALAHEDKSVVPPERKDVDALCSKIRQCHQRQRRSSLLCMKIRWLCHLRPRTTVPSEAKDASALAHEYKVVVPSETKGDDGALEHEDKADVPSESKGDGSPLVHEDKVDVQPETKGDNDAIAHEDKADVSPKTKDAGNVVLVDVPAVHYSFLPLRPHTILCYILAEIKRQQNIGPPAYSRWNAYKSRKGTMGEIKKRIETMGIDKKIEAITDEILKFEVSRSELSELQELHMGGETLADKISAKTLGQLFWMLIYQSSTSAASEQDKNINSMVAHSHDIMIKQTVKKLQLEIGLQEKIEYKDILSELFPNLTTTAANVTPRNLTTTAANVTPTIMVDDIIKDMVKKEVKEMLAELRELDTSDKNQETGSEAAHQLRELDTSNKNQETSSEAAQTTQENDFAERTKKVMIEIKMKITEQLKVKMVVQEIQECLKGNNKILVILKVYDKYVPQWEVTRNNLSLLGLECPITGAVIVAQTTWGYNKQYFGYPLLYNLKRGKTLYHQYFGYPELEPIEYSLAGLYFDTVLQVTSQYMNDRHSHRVLRDILCECKQHEFCMKIFAHALRAKPKRSGEELSKLHNTLFDASVSELHSNMLEFSCKDLPKEYMSCLLYLAIFPQGQTIRRSTLIGRWVAERLITTKDWHWSSSVYEAEKCFDALVARYLVCPAGIGGAGKVKSCTVHKLVYRFITKIAVQQHILETRLSYHLAHHFSIFSDIRLRSSDTIEDFFNKSSQFYKLKVLDLEGCHYFPQNEHYLSDICRKILMLKYLSLRGTGVTRLPSEINNLQELEVLDIRETYIPASATRNVLLRKLKRLLAGQKLKDLMASHVDSSQRSLADKTEKVECVEVMCNGKLQNVLKRLLPSHVYSSSADYSSVEIPEKIEKMLGVEVLSNVKPKNQQDLVNIATLIDLKKLGVVINKESDLKPLLYAISDLLHQSLRFLSITLDITIYKNTAADRSLQNKPKDLESLTINGSKKCPEDITSTSTQMGKLLESLTGNGKQLAKVNLSCTFLTQENLKVLAKLEKLRCVKLQHNAYTESKLIFNKGEFTNLNNFLVEGNNMTEITFDSGAASNLEKVVLSSTNIVSINGVNCLQKLVELELKGTNNMEMVHSFFDNAKRIAKVTLRDTMLEQGDLKILAINKKMCSQVLLGKFYNGGSHVIFQDEFQKLKLLIVDSSDITEISFTNRSPNLEKIVWSCKEIVSLSGIDKLPALKELELKGGDSVPNRLKEDIKKLKIRLDYKPRDKPKK